ncbi:hypothetical protein DXG01_005248 [Tephrocybe rancida]|nr:hypothetical protein DXG01_005248 [Tephrocybe rancida]
MSHAIRQLKLVLPGGVVTYYLGTLHEFWQITQREGSWGQTAAFGALGLGVTTIALFIYVLMTPWIKGVEPNYRSWRESGILSSVIPVLTATIVVGLLLLVLTLGQWSSLGYLRGTLGGPMYNNDYGSPEITNNPFVADPTNAQSRYPDLLAAPGQNSWPQTPSNMGYQQPQGMYQQPSYQQQQPSPGYGAQAPGYLSPNPMSQGMATQQTGMPFQPTSSFGQQLAANLSGSSYGYLQGQNGSSQQQGYQPAQQQLQSPGYLAQFDPYASIGQGWAGEPQPQNQPQQNQSQPQSQLSNIPGAPASTTSLSPSGVSHPREYLRTHKGEIEAWDAYAWKQLLNSFDALKDSWDERAKEIEGKATQLQMQLQYGGGGYHPAQVQQEGARLQGLHKEAKSLAGRI